MEPSRSRTGTRALQLRPEVRPRREPARHIPHWASNGRKHLDENQGHKSLSPAGLQVPSLELGARSIGTACASDARIKAKTPQTKNKAIFDIFISSLAGSIRCAGTLQLDLMTGCRESNLPPVSNFALCRFGNISTPRVAGGQGFYRDEVSGTGLGTSRGSVPYDEQTREGATRSTRCRDVEGNFVRPLIQVKARQLVES